MSTFKRFEDISAWQKARILTKEIFNTINKSHFSKNYELKNQLTRSSISVMSNIAEGFDRGGTGEFIQFLSIAKGSLGEIKSQLYIAMDQGYLIKKDFDNLYLMADEVSRMIAGLQQYLRKSPIKGIKYKSLDNKMDSKHNLTNQEL